MASNIKFKRSAVQNRVPTTAQLDLGELALNTYDGKLYTEINTGSAAVVEIGSKLSSLVVDGANGAGGGDVVFHGQTAGRDVTWDYSDNALEFAQNAKATFGDSLFIYNSTSAANVIAFNSTDLFVTGSNFRVTNPGISENIAWFKSDAEVELYYNNGLRFETTQDGADIFGTGSLKIPVGTTAQRSPSPTAGDLRYNTTTSSFEGYSTAWGDIGAGGIGIGSDASNPRTGIIQNRVGVGFTDLNIVGAGISVTGYGTTVFVDFNEFKPGSFHRTIHNYTATAGQTTFAGLNYSISEKQIAVYLNGARLSEATYTATSGTTVVLDVGASVGDEVEIVNIHTNSDVDRKVNTYTATAGQTTFTGLSYNSKQELDVYLNGIRLASADFTATSGNTVVLAVGASVNDTVDIVSTGDGITWRSTTDASGDRFTLNNVGIGTDQTPDKLNVRGNSSFVGVTTFTGTVSTTGSFGTSGQIQSTYDDASQPRLYLSGISGSSGYNYLLRGDNDAGSRAVHFVNGSARSADNGANTYTIRNDNGKLHLGKTNQLAVLQGSTTYLQHGSSTKLNTTSTGVSITGNSVVSGNVTAVDGTFSGNLSVGGVVTYDDVTNVDSVGIITARSGLFAPDNASLKLGNTAASPDLEIVHQSGENHFLLNSGNTFFKGDVAWGVRTSGNQSIIAVNGSSRFVDLFGSTNKVLSTTGVGVTIRSGLYIENAEFNMTTNGNKILDFETGGSNHVNFRHNPSDSGNTTFMKAIHGGALELYHDGNGTKQCETYSAGLDIVAGKKVRFSHANAQDGNDGTISSGVHAEGLTFVGTQTVSGNGRQITHYGNISPSNNTQTALGSSSKNYGYLYSIRLLALYDSNSTGLYIGAGSDIRGYHDGTNSYFTNKTGDFYIGNTHNDEIKFITQNNTRWNIDGSGHLVPETAGAVNIGSASAEIGDIYFANSKGLKLGSNQAGDLYNDGTDTYFRNSASNGQMLIRSNGNILISNYAADEYRIKTFNNGAVELYYDQSAHATAKLATTATGVSVHGEVAATQDYPNFRPTLDFNFAAQKKLDSRITYQRTGPSSFTNEFGKVVLVGENEPRFDHDPVTRESKGLLVEHQRTNSWTYSQPTSEAAFGANGTFTYEAATAPNGETEAFRLANNPAASSNSYHRATRAITFGSNSMVLSVWAKGENGNNYFIWSFQNLGGAIVRAGFKLEGDGETSIVTNGNGGHTLQIQKYPDGWYRCIIIANTQSSGSTTQFLYTASGYSESSSATGGSTLLWGFQLEVGSYVTSYIPTNSSSITRGADFTTLLEDDFTDAISQTEGTLVAEYDNVTSDGYVLSLDGSGGDKIGMVNSNGYQLMGKAGGSSQGQTDNGTLLSGTNRFVLAYKTNDAAISINGNDATVDTTYTLPTTTFMSIGHRQYQYDQLGSCIARIMYYNTRLPNSQLKTLSTR